MIASVIKAEQIIALIFPSGSKAIYCRSCERFKCTQRVPHADQEEAVRWRTAGKRKVGKTMSREMRALLIPVTGEA
jgi:hypothetical protein